MRYDRQKLVEKLTAGSMELGIVGSVHEEWIEEVITDGLRRCEAARNAGGIPAKSVAQGMVVPEGYWLDNVTNYYIPPNVELM